MAALTQNLSDNIRFLSPATIWNTPMKWGTDFWGYGIGFTGSFQTPTQAGSFHNDTGPNFTDALFLNRSTTFNDNLYFAQGTSQSEYKYDGSGHYTYILGGGFTNNESVVNPSYTIITHTTASWNLISNSSSSWVTIQ